MYQFVFHFKSWNILSHLEVEMIKKCSVSESQKWNISTMSKENLPICLNISLIKKYRDFIFFFHLLFREEKKNKVLSLNTSKSDKTLFWQKQAYKCSSDIPSCCGNYWQDYFKESVSQKHVYNLLHQSISSLRCHCTALSEHPAERGSHTLAVWSPSHCPKIIWRHNSFTSGRAAA